MSDDLNSLAPIMLALSGVLKPGMELYACCNQGEAFSRISLSLPNGDVIEGSFPFHTIADNGGSRGNISY
jgi:hypothetical protein